MEATVERADRWRNLAAANDVDGDATDSPAMRSPYEHPEWREAGAEAAVEPPAASNEGGAPFSLPAENAAAEDASTLGGIEPAVNFIDPTLAAFAGQVLAERQKLARHLTPNNEEMPAAAADACQSYPDSRQTSPSATHRKPFLRNGLKKSPRSSPLAAKSRGGEDNGLDNGCLHAYVGNGCP